MIRPAGPRVKVYYVIKGTEQPGSLEKRMAARAEHLARLQELKQEGRLLVAGPLPAIDSDDPGPAGYTGSLIIAEFASLEQAQRWAQGDPYVRTGVFTDVTVEPFRQVLP